MIIAGVDCSTRKIAIFRIEDGRGVASEITCNEHDTSTRINVMFQAVVDVIKKLKPDMVYIENSPYLQNIKVTLAIHSVVDAVRYACVLAKVPFQTVEVTSWKKDVLGNGRADKDEIFQFAKAKWGEDIIKNQDVADSACICLYGWRRMHND